MKGLLVGIKREGPIVYLYIRCENGEKRVLKVTDFRPYFYVPDPKGKYVSFTGERLRKIVVSDPSDVRDFRERYKDHYEADIPYTRRFLIDTGIRSGLEFPNDAEEVFWRDLKPVDDIDIEPRAWFLDIEVFTTGKFPDPTRAQEKVTAISIYDTYEKRYYTYILADGEGPKKEDVEFTIKTPSGDDKVRTTVLTFPNEDDLLFFFVKHVIRVDPDVLIGWNIEEFDLQYLNNRLKVLSIPYRIECETFDYMKFYSKESESASYIRLKKVAVSEDILDKSEIVEPEDLYGLYKNNKAEFIKYNLKDVYILVKLEEKHGIYSFNLQIKKYAGVAHFRDLLGSSVIIDTLLLREAKERGVVLPSVREHKVKSIEGAVVFNPPPGIFEDVAQYDMSRYYPSIIITLNLSPETKGVPASKKVGLLPSLAKRLIDERAKYERELTKYEPGSEEWKSIKNKIATIKAITNTIYGYTLYGRSRIYDPEVAETITRVAREGIKHVAEFVSGKGHRVLYGDTDSIFIQVPFDEAYRLLEEINMDIQEFFREKYRVDEVYINMKLEKYNKRILFTGAKKRYAAWVVWEKEPCDYIHITGFEAIRTDQSRFTKELQRGLLEVILKSNPSEVKEKAKKYIEKKFEELKHLSLDDIAIEKRIDKPFEQYKVKPPHVRGAILANMYLGANIVPGQRVKMVYVKAVEGIPRTDVIAFEDAEQLKGRKVIIDWDRMIDVTVTKKIEDLLKLIGLSVSGSRAVSHMNQKRLTRWFK